MPVDEAGSIHVLIYGPPAAGKLTVARTLATKYGLRLLDNHLTFDVALRLFDFGTPAHPRLVEALRCVLLRAAAEARLNVVSTLVFAHPIDRAHVQAMVEASGDAVAMHFVQLLPSEAELERRVLDPSRTSTEKIRDVETLHSVLGSYDLKTRIHDTDLVIDNTGLAPRAVADGIAAHVGLVAT